ncbi:MAG: C4-dicarboxylate TRAP transporter substrate-binding protein [Thalassovita sp.]
MKRREFLARSSTTMGLLAAPTLLRAAGNTIKLSVATGHAPVVTWVERVNNYFIPEVNRRLKENGADHAVEWTTAYSGTVAKIGGEIDAVEQQIVDLAIVGASFNPAKLPLHVVSYFTPFVSSKYDVVIPTVDALNSKIPAMGQAWRKNGLHYLGGIGVDNFQLFLKEPAQGLADLEGKKIGGIGPNLNWLKGANITPVQVNPPQIYNDLATGVYDGCLLPAGLGFNFKAHEVAPYMLAADFGAMSWGALAINARRMSRLPDPVQEVIAAVGRDYQAEMVKTQTSLETRGIDAMKSAGLSVIDMSQDAKAEWANALPNIAKDWAAPLEAKGLPASQVIASYIEDAQSRGATVIRDWTKGL